MRGTASCWSHCSRSAGQAVISATETAHVPSVSALRIEVSAGTLSAEPALRAA